MTRIVTHIESFSYSFSPPCVMLFNVALWRTKYSVPVVEIISDMKWEAKDKHMVYAELMVDAVCSILTDRHRQEIH